MALNAVKRATAAWANSAAVGTQVEVDISVDDMAMSLIAKYLVIVRNPSAETALTGTIKTKYTDSAGVVRYATKKALGAAGADEVVAIPVNTIKEFIVEGFVAAQGGRITLSNDTAVGVAGAFTADIEVRAI